MERKHTHEIVLIGVILLTYIIAFLFLQGCTTRRTKVVVLDYGDEAVIFMPSKEANKWVDIYLKAPEWEEVE